MKDTLRKAYLSQEKTMPTDPKRLKGQGFEELIREKDSFQLLKSLALESDEEEENPIRGMSFEDFVQDIFSKSYPMHDFNAWHIHFICNQVDKLLLKPSNRYLTAALPRYHLKSTILGEAISVYRMLTAYGDGMYISFKDELAMYHLSHIKEAIRTNPTLSKSLIDMSPQSDAIINYKMGNKKMKIFGSGIMAVKRGIHTDTIVIADDILGDLANPMVLTEMDKVKRLFNAEIMNIPNKECPLFVFGTVMDYSDILFTLKDNPNFLSIWLPAINPTIDREILWPEKFDRQTLDDKKNSTDWKSFSTEFLLTPMMATEAFMTREQLAKVINKNLQNFKVPGW
jgi:hypothetical protein